MDIKDSKKRAASGEDSDRPSKAKKMSTRNRNFRQHLIDRGYFRVGHDDEPANLEEIHNRLIQPRPSLSPACFPREAFLTFWRIHQDASNEAKVMNAVFPIITATTAIPSEMNVQFETLEDLTDGSITKAQPHHYDGTRPAKLNTQIREDFAPYIVPSTNNTLPCLPNFFTEVKGPDGSMAPYTSRTTQLRSFAMDDTPDTFRQGATALRNARDWVKEKWER
ncbi:MAG: hypothetical protein Q9217_000936 [Psora testacea]